MKATAIQYWEDFANWVKENNQKLTLRELASYLEPYGLRGTSRSALLYKTSKKGGEVDERFKNAIIDIDQRLNHPVRLVFASLENLSTAPIVMATTQDTFNAPYSDNKKSYLDMEGFNVANVKNDCHEKYFTNLEIVNSLNEGSVEIAVMSKAKYLSDIKKEKYALNYTPLTTICFSDHLLYGIAKQNLDVKYYELSKYTIGVIKGSHADAVLSQLENSKDENNKPIINLYRIDYKPNQNLSEKIANYLIEPVKFSIFVDQPPFLDYIAEKMKHFQYVPIADFVRSVSNKREFNINKLIVLVSNELAKSDNLLQRLSRAFVKGNRFIRYQQAAALDILKKHFVKDKERWLTMKEWQKIRYHIEFEEKATREYLMPHIKVDNPIKAVLAYQHDLSVAPLLLALVKEKSSNLSLFDKNMIYIEPKPMASSGLALRELLENNAEIATVSEEVYFEMSMKQDFKGIYRIATLYWPGDLINGLYYGKKLNGELPTKLRDLYNKQIGFIRGTQSEYLIRKNFGSRSMNMSNLHGYDINLDAHRPNDYDEQMIKNISRDLLFNDIDVFIGLGGIVAKVQNWININAEINIGNSDMRHDRQLHLLPVADWLGISMSHCKTVVLVKESFIKDNDTQIKQFARALVLGYWTLFNAMTGLKNSKDTLSGLDEFLGYTPTRSLREIWDEMPFFIRYNSKILLDYIFKKQI